MRFNSWLSLILMTTLFFGCTPATEDETQSEAPVDVEKRSVELAKQFLILDGHVDLPYRMRGHGDWIDVSTRTSDGDFDYVRAREGGLDAPFMSIYIPSSYQEMEGGKELADSLIEMVHQIAERYPDKFAMAYSAKDVEDNFAKGLISLPMGMENGAPIGDDIKNVAYFQSRGIRYITLTHATNNLICDSSYDTEKTWNGLSEFGQEVVAEMNRTGIMVDVSHVSDDTFYQVMEISTAPVIASHSSCRNFTPGFERNMSDEMIKMLGENGGVIQINFGSSFLDGDVVEANDKREEAFQALLEERGLTEDSPEAQEALELFNTENPKHYADVTDVADHIDHVVKLAGIDHVGLGSDFDGVGDSLPTGLKDVSGFPNLIAELLRRGYSEEDIEKICSGNVLRVWKEVERVAEM